MPALCRQWRICTARDFSFSPTRTAQIPWSVGLEIDGKPFLNGRFSACLTQERVYEKVYAIFS